MDPCTVVSECRTADFATVESVVRDLDGVERVGSVRPKQNNKDDVTTVFITFSDEQKAKAAESKLRTVPGLMTEEIASNKESKKQKRGKERSKNVTAEFLQYQSYSDQPRQSRNKEGASESRRGGRGRGGQQRGRGRGRGGYNQRLPPYEANVAVADNVPFGTPNKTLIDLFGAHGRIVDINRYDLMAMICFDNPESVQQSIQHVNGTKINDNVITVSSGTVNIPGNVAHQLGM